MKYLIKLGESIVVSIISTIIFTGTAFLQGYVVFQKEGAGLVSTLLISPLSILLGPILYFTLLKKILNVNRIGGFILLNFFGGIFVIFILHEMSGVGWYFINFTTPMVTVLVSIMIRIYAAEYSQENEGI